MHHQRKSRIERAQARLEAGCQGGPKGLRRKVKDGDLTISEAVASLDFVDSNNPFLQWADRRRKTAPKHRREK